MTRLSPFAILAEIDFGSLYYSDPLLRAWDQHGQDLADAPTPSRHRPRGATIGLEGISKVFSGTSGPGTGAKALDDVSLAVAGGEIFGIIGRSGAGKSTLLRCINRLETPTAGRVLVAGEDVAPLPQDRLPALRRRIGMIFQHFNLLSAKTVFENVALPLMVAGEHRRTIRRKVDELLDLVGLADKRDAYPARLSGGQKQRVGIARALVHDPEVLLCDEATSALDPETTHAILGLLQDINCRLGPTIVLITHEMAVVRQVCDRVAVLDEGRLVEQGRVWEVFARPRADATRRLLATVTAPLPRSLADRLTAAPDGDSDVVVDLRILDDGGGRPVLAELVRATGSDFQVLHGAVEEIQGRRVGRLLLALPHRSPERLEEVLDFLGPRSEGVEVLGYVRRAA